MAAVWNLACIAVRSEALDLHAYCYAYCDNIMGVAWVYCNDTFLREDISPNCACPSQGGYNQYEETTHL